MLKNLWFRSKSLREALGWIKDQNQRDVVMKTDCLVVIQAMRGPSILLSCPALTD